ncbi:MAG TPA: NADH-quinone oxidoreductase subunit N [Candidatus Kapabacteria bacterium]|nr:NADH-quinone oxidoreductase subunit N [Candidatus Kapabacteria bacterium]
MTNEFILGLPLYLTFALSIIVILVDTFSNKNKKVLYYYSIISYLAIIAAGFYIVSLPIDSFANIDKASLFTKGMVNYGGFANLFDIIFAVGGLLTIFAGLPYLKKEFDDYKEFYTLVLFSVFGMMLIAHANHLIMIFLGIEVMSVTFYVLSGFIRNRISAVEAALKYFLLGAFSTGFLLYGMAMTYGATKTMYLDQIQQMIVAGTFDITFLKIGFALITVGLSFKIAAFPFHQWAADVYHGAPTVVSGFMSTAGKAAALAAFILIGKSMLPLIPSDLTTDIAVATHKYVGDAQMIIAIISAVTMLFGNILALIQKNVKRMLAYSSIAHAGYLLMGIVSNNANGWSGIIFYSAAYMFMQIGAFIVVSILEKNEKFLNLEDYSGISKKYPFLAAMMAMFMFSLVGLPPFAGFPGKYVLFAAAIESGFTWLAIVAVVSTIISLYFYIGLVIYMYFKDADSIEVESNPGTASVTLILSAIFVLVLGVFPGYLIDFAVKLF